MDHKILWSFPVFFPFILLLKGLRDWTRSTWKLIISEPRCEAGRIGRADSGVMVGGFRGDDGTMEEGRKTEEDDQRREQAGRDGGSGGVHRSVLLKD